MKKFFIFLPTIILSIFVVSNFVLAADPLKYKALVDIDLDRMGPAAETTATEYISNFIDAFMAVVVAMALYKITIGGIKLMMAGDNPSMKGEGRNDITQAVYGLILALLTFTILVKINPALIPGSDLFSNMKLK